MEYKILIEKRTKNENFNQEYKDWQERRRYSFNTQAPQEFTVDRVLEVSLTEDEFKKLKVEVIKGFE